MSLLKGGTPGLMNSLGKYSDFQLSQVQIIF